MDHTKILLLSFLSLFFTLALASCSNQQAYEAVQQSRLHECQKMPPTAAEKCKAQYSQSYEDYKENREEALSE